MAFQTQIDLVKAEPPPGAKLIWMVLQKGMQLVIRRRGGVGYILRQKFQLLLKPSPDDGVIAIQPHRHRLAIIYFLPNVVADQSFELVGGRRTQPRSGKALREMVDLNLRNDDFSRLAGVTFDEGRMGGE